MNSQRRRKEGRKISSRISLLVDQGELDQKIIVVDHVGNRTISPHENWRALKPQGARRRHGLVS